MLDVQRTVVSDLTLGQGSSRKALLERIATPRGVRQAAGGAAGARQGVCDAAVGRARGRRSARTAWMRASSSRRCGRWRDEPLRADRDRDQDARAARAVAVRPAGRARRAPRRGGSAARRHRRVARIAEPEEGRYTAVFMDGSERDRLQARRRARRRAGAEPAARRRAGLGAALQAGRPTRSTCGPRSWSSCSTTRPTTSAPGPTCTTLLRDPARNLLLDHLGLGEDAAIELVPDCADLPYALRAYFAWKMRPAVRLSPVRARPRPACRRPAASCRPT